jgi:hypothetical protein
VTALLFSLPIVLSLAGSPAASQEQAAKLPSGPETFHLTATATAEGEVSGSVTVPIVVRLERYTPEFARTALTDALKYRGYPGFLLGLRGAPRVGSLEVGGRTSAIRWAVQTPAGDGRTITIVTDSPVFFVGLGKPGAKATKGYETAVMKLELDAKNHGQGVMAAAARVKPDGAGGVVIDDYAQKPLTLRTAPAPVK